MNFKNKSLADNLEQIELGFEISNFCLSKCLGCTYSKEDRNDKMMFPIKEYDLIYQAFYNVTKPNKILVENGLGPAETFFIPKNDLYKYLEVSNKYFQNYIEEYSLKKEDTLFAFAISTTFKLKDFIQKFELMRNYVKSNNKFYEILLEFIFDPTNVEDSYNTVMKNINYLREFTNNLTRDEGEIQLVNIIAFTEKMYKTDPKILIQNIKKYDLKRVDIQYIFNSTYPVPDFHLFLEFYSKLKEEGKKEGIEFQDKIYQDCEKKYEYGRNVIKGIDFIIDKDLNCWLKIDNPFGNLVYNVEPFVSFKGINEKNINKYSIKILNSFTKHLMKNNTEVNNEECNQCNSKDKCFYKYNIDLKNKYTIEHKKDNCFGNYDLL